MQSEHESQRLFVAISIPLAVKAELQRFQSELADSLPEDAVRWTRPAQLHLTLRFLGNVEISRTDELIQKLTVACRKFRALQLKAERIGFFPERGFPRVIWAPVSDKSGQLGRLQSTIQSATLEFTSEPAEKEFTGHVTLGRVKRVRHREADTLRNFADEAKELVFGEWAAEQVELMKSELTPDGPRYTILTKALFASGA